MAIGDFRLTNSRYVRPGTYVGYVRIPRPTAAPGTPRYPCYVGRGSRLAQVINLAHRRSYVENRQLNFSLTPPYKATLPYPAVNNKEIAFLYKQNREVVTNNKWSFRESNPGSGVYDQVEIQLTEFDKNATYLIDYQSTERDEILDPLGFDELRQMTYVGNSEGQDLYEEFIDYRIVTDLLGNTIGGDPDALIPGEDNSQLEGRNESVVPDTTTIYASGSHTGLDNAATLTDSTKSWTPNEHVGRTIYNLTDGSSGVITANTANTVTATLAGGTDNDWDSTPTADAYTIVGNAGTALVSHAVDSEYLHPYSMHYEIYLREIDLGGGGGGEDLYHWEIIISPLSGGNAQENKVPEHSDMIGTRPYEAGVNRDGRAVEFVVTKPLTGIYGTNNATVVISDEAGYFEDGIKLYFDWDEPPATADGYDFVVGDHFTWNSYGPGLIEFWSAHDNDNQFSEVSTPVEYVNTITGATSGSSSGTITISDRTMYDGDHDRKYRVNVYYASDSLVRDGPTGDGPTGTRQFELFWSSWGENPYSEGKIEIDEATPSTLSERRLEDGIYIDINLGAGHTTADNDNLITAGQPTNLATALALAANAQTSYNNHDNDIGLGGPYHDAGSGNNQLTLTTAPTNLPELIDVCKELQLKYVAHVNDNEMHIPIDDIWTLDPDTVISDLGTCVEFLADFKAKFNRHARAVNFAEGDTWIFTAYAPRKDYTAKDDRLYKFTVGGVGATNDLEYIDLSWYTNTFEGGFGSFTLTYDDPYVELTDSIGLVARNFPSADATVEQYATNDQFQFGTVNEDKIDWSLRTRAFQTIPADEIFQDVLGQVTGTPLSYYIILNDVPESVIWVKNGSTGTLLSYSMIFDQGRPTPYISFPSDPGVDVEVYFEHRGREPDPGNIYYISANRLRLDNEYDTPTRYLTREEMERGLGPKASDNQIWIMGDIAFDTNFFGAYFTQVKDAGGNQVFSTADFRRAIQATETVKEITDLVVLSFFAAIGEAKASIERMADPFENAERMLWVGAQTGTPIGSVDEPESLIYLANKTLQFSGDNPARGHVVLIGNPSCERSLVLDNGTTIRVELDGSFIAGYTAAKNAEFTDPANTLLRKDVASFDTVQTWGEKEELLLGEASICYLSDVGSGIYRYQESTTVDTSSPDLNEISAMNQKIYVTRKVVRDMDSALISVVPPSPAAGVAIVRAFLADELASIVSSGVIAPYGSETNPPTIRQISPTSDVYVFVDERDRRLYHFGYFYNLRYPIKRLFGLYSVDTKFWDSRQ